MSIESSTWASRLILPCQTGYWGMYWGFSVEAILNIIRLRLTFRYKDSSDPQCPPLPIVGAQRTPLQSQGIRSSGKRLDPKLRSMHTQARKAMSKKRNGDNTDVDDWGACNLMSVWSVSWLDWLPKFVSSLALDNFVLYIMATWNQTNTGLCMP